MQTHLEIGSAPWLHQYAPPWLHLLWGVQAAVESILAWDGVRHAKQILSQFFQRLNDRIIHPRHIEFITHNELMHKPGFQDLLTARLEDTLRSSEILSDGGASLQEFLLALAQYPEVFKKVDLPPPTVDVLYKRVEYLRTSGQSGSIITMLTWFLAKH